MEAAAATAESVQCFGRKKTAVAVTHCKRGKGLIKINGVPIELVQPEILRIKPIIELRFQINYSPITLVSSITSCVTLREMLYTFLRLRPVIQSLKDNSPTKIGISINTTNDTRLPLNILLVLILQCLIVSSSIENSPKSSRSSNHCTLVQQLPTSNTSQW
ncbi:hypothetical protein H5410_021150 [Solanum commersonii]|uniref:40S ribosomal protein S16 n=1 Tax=Solanum commersonii TaxID=4109 RepID=A0A9J5ZBU9_SOLCO|nr:hypothetical protein H5410_021150 [Solanum commersonii]